VDANEAIVAYTEAEGLGWAVRNAPDGDAAGRLAGLQRALAALRRVDTVDRILEEAPRAVCEHLGFDRAVLFRVVDGRMVMASAWFTADPEGAKAVLEFSRGVAPQLDHLLLETEMIRRRAPCLVRDAVNDPRVNRAIVEFSRTRSYVSAPIMPAAKVIGFVHAEARYQGRVMDEVDRDTVWAFAEGFGLAFERTVLLQRLRAQRSEMQALLASAGSVMDALTDAELELAEATSSTAGDHVAPADRDAARPSLEALLTRRELEVLELMAAGRTNAAIAAELVVAPGTVKSHVKHILRKLRAANRAEAVSRYLRLSRGR
jgi:DNA-binding CsgD family transcriptional regulator